MSPKCRTLQTLVALRFVPLCRRIWHSALKGGVVVAPLPAPENQNPKPKIKRLKPKIKRLKPCLLKKANPKLSPTAGAEKNGRGKAPLTIPSVMQACKSCLLVQGAKNFLQKDAKTFCAFSLAPAPNFIF